MRATILLFIVLFCAVFARAAVTLTATSTGLVYSNTITITGTATIKRIVILGGNVSRITYNYTKNVSPQYPDFYNSFAGDGFIIIGGNTVRNFPIAFTYSSPDYTFDFPTDTGTIFRIEVGTGAANSPDASRKKSYTVAPNETMELNEAQSISLTPTSATVKQGETATFTASGGHNGYLWSVTGGGGLSDSGGTNAVFTASTLGTFTLQVRNAAGGGYAESNIASATITVTEVFKVKAALPDNIKGKRPVEYAIVQDGVTLGTWTQMPGASLRTVEVEAAPPPAPKPDVLSRVVGLVQDDGSGVWNVVDGAFSAWTKSATLTPSSAPTAAVVTPPNAPNKASTNEGEQQTRGVWSNVTNTNTSNNVTNAVYAEGTDKTLGALDEIRKNTGAVADLFQEYKDLGPVGAIPSDEGTVLDLNAKISSMLGPIEDAMRAKVTSKFEEYGEAVTKFPAGAAPATAAGAAIDWQLSVPLANGTTFTQSLNPLSHEFVGSMFRFVKSLLTWITAIIFTICVMRNTNEMVFAIVSAQTTTAAPVSVEAMTFGGGTGIPSALIKAGICTALVFVLVPIGFAIFTQDFGGISLFARFLINPVNAAVADAGGGSWFAQGLTLANALIPIDFTLVCLVSWAGHKMLGQGTIIAFATAMRWVAA